MIWAQKLENRARRQKLPERGPHRPADGSQAAQEIGHPIIGLVDCVKPLEMAWKRAKTTVFTNTLAVHPWSAAGLESPDKRGQGSAWGVASNSKTFLHTIT